MIIVGNNGRFNLFIIIIFADNDLQKDVGNLEEIIQRRDLWKFVLFIQETNLSFHYLKNLFAVKKLLHALLRLR